MGMLLMTRLSNFASSWLEPIISTGMNGPDGATEGSLSASGGTEKVGVPGRRSVGGIGVGSSTAEGTGMVVASGDGGELHRASHQQGKTELVGSVKHDAAEDEAERHEKDAQVQNTEVADLEAALPGLGSPSQDDGEFGELSLL
jgi:hypothetical protein